VRNDAPRICCCISRNQGLSSWRTELVGSCCMELLSRLVSQYVPWMRPVLAWCLAGITLLLVLAIPCYFIVFPVARRVRQALATYLRHLLQRQSEACEKRDAALSRLCDSFSEDPSLSCLPALTGGAEAVLARLSNTLAALNGPVNRILDIPQTFSRLIERLADTLPTSGGVLPEMPLPGQLAAENAGLRIARMRVLVSSVILLGLMAVNTGMLGQILRDLNFIPHDLVYLGIPLYLILAFILTLAEAGLGFIHTAGRPTPDETEKLPVWPLVAVVFALSIACVEGFFYSQVAPNKEGLVELPFIGYQFKQAQLFFLWGATLVMALFGLGSVWTTSLERVAGAGDHFPRLLRRLLKDRQALADAYARAARSAEHVRGAADTAQNALRMSAGHAEELARSLREIAAATTSMRQSPPGARSDSPHTLSRIEAEQFLQHCGIWLTVASVSAAVLFGTGIFGVGYAFPHLPAAATWLTSLGIVVMFAILGFLFPRGELILDGAGSRRLVASGSLWRAPLSLVLAALVCVGFFTLFTRVRLAHYQVTLWVFMFVLGAFVCGAASQVIATGKGLRVWLRRTSGRVLALLDLASRLVVRLLFAASLLLECVGLFFAAPIFIVRGRDLPALSSETEEAPSRGGSAKGQAAS